MIVQFWKSKLQNTLFFLFMIALLSQAPSANAQSASVDIPPNPAWGGRTGQIAGTVYLNRNGEPASKVLVNIRSMLSGVSHAAETDFDGHFALSEIPQGTYEVSASEQGYGFASTITEVGLFPTEINLYLSSSSGPARGANPYAVSLRELKIPLKAQNEFGRGLDLMAKGDFAGSIAHLSKAAAVFPDYYEAVYHIGVAELRLNHQDKAMEAFQKSINLSGGHYASPQFAYGLILCNQGKPAEAERLIRRGLEIDENSAEGHLFLGIALLDQNRLEEAEKSLREALLRKPQYADVYLVLADVHAKRRDYQAQVQDLDIYLKLVPSAAGSDYVRKVREAAKRLISDPRSQN